MKKIFLYLLSLFLIYAGISGLSSIIYNSYLLVEGQSWKPHNAKIISFEIKKIPTRGGSNYIAKIEYEFLYKHKKIKGDTFTLLVGNSLKIKERKEFPKKYRKDRNIEVYINIDNPQHSSVIKPKLSSLFFNFFLMMLYIMMIGIGYFWGGYNIFYNRKQAKIKTKVKNRIWSWWIIYPLVMFYFLFLSVVVGITNGSEKVSFSLVGIITLSIFFLYLFTDLYRSKVKKNSKFMGKVYWIRKDAKIFKKIVYTKFLLGLISLFCVIYLSIHF